ncbi:MAG: hypothetical protein PVG53_01130 [Holophagae bacterium]
MVRRKKTKRTSGNRNAPASQRASRNRYTPAEIFMAAIGALLIVLVLGIVITSLLGG